MQLREQEPRLGDGSGEIIVCEEHHLQLGSSHLLGQLTRKSARIDRQSLQLRHIYLGGQLTRQRVLRLRRALDHRLIVQDDRLELLVHEESIGQRPREAIARQPKLLELRQIGDGGRQLSRELGTVKLKFDDMPIPYRNALPGSRALRNIPPHRALPVGTIQCVVKADQGVFLRLRDHRRSLFAPKSVLDVISNLCLHHEGRRKHCSCDKATELGKSFSHTLISYITY